MLRKNGIAADFYHAGLSSEVRHQRQDAWISNQTRVIVATNAFGMGIDKPDVRFVIHADLPDSLEAYFQEAGRAGRDGQKSVAVLLYNPSDKLKLQKHLSVVFPSIDYVKRIYEAICNFLQVAVGFGKNQVFDFPLERFAEKFHFQVAQVYHSMKIIQRQGYFEFTEEVDSPSRIYFTVSRDELYNFQIANEAYDGFIKLLMRSYTGLFTGYVMVEEELLAARAATTPDVIVNFLKQLHNQRIIDYVPRRKSPYIYFSRGSGGTGTASLFP